MVSSSFWKDRKVLITGHTGFKGSWLTLWLHLLGARVSGLSLAPPSDPNLFELLGCQELLTRHEICDIRDFKKLSQLLSDIDSQIVFHLAAQPIVRIGYKEARTTFETNVMGTVNVLELVRHVPTVKVVVVVTSDKCYCPSTQTTPYKEEDPLGGEDPYSASKACAEIVCKAYQHLFSSNQLKHEPPMLLTARAGNILGGGDFGVDRLVPDCIRAIVSNTLLQVRHPNYIRSWIHVLDAIRGYLLLAESGLNKKASSLCTYNFATSTASSVASVVEGLASRLNLQYEYTHNIDSTFAEAPQLMLDPTRAKQELGWQSQLSFELILESITNFTVKYQQKSNLLLHCLEEIKRFEALCR